MNLLTMERLRLICEDELTGDAAHALANSGVLYEATVAISALRDTGCSERDIVELVNLRSFFAEFGRTPFLTGQPFEVLVAEGTLASLGPSQYAARLPLSGGELIVELKGSVKTCEWVRFVNGFDVFELVPPGEDELVHGQFMRLVLGNPQLLRDMQMLYRSFGMAFTPREYVTVEGFILEHAAETMESLMGFF